jgi:GSH-dependent disulfide-bond oxidoreductase
MWAPAADNQGLRAQGQGCAARDFQSARSRRYPSRFHPSHVYSAKQAVMIDLYYWTTPNGHKVTIFLEEAGLKYNIIPVNIGKGEQFKAEFLAIAPNNRIPAIVDKAPPDGGEPISIFESGAILFYLANKTGKFIANDMRERVQTLEWLFWQMGGLGPMAGQNNHFSAYAPEKIPYAIDRYRNEVNRLFGVMNKRLADRNYLAGNYSIADMACYPWVLPWERQGQNIEDFPHLKRWLEAIKARPAVVKAYEWTPKINPGAGGIRTAEERAILFGQTAKSITDAATAKQ